jgi:hypothetical protein
MLAWLFWIIYDHSESTPVERTTIPKPTTPASGGLTQVMTLQTTCIGLISQDPRQDKPQWSLEHPIGYLQSRWEEGIPSQNSTWSQWLVELEVLLSLVQMQSFIVMPPSSHPPSSLSSGTPISSPARRYFSCADPGVVTLAQKKTSPKWSFFCLLVIF